MTRRLTSMKNFLGPPYREPNNILDLPQRRRPKTEFHNLSDKERDRLNLPPVGFQGEEFTSIIQAPTSKALQTKVDQFRLFAKAKNYETFDVLQHGPDPDGGFRAIVSAHNWNPLTWAAEKAHRAYLGAKHGVAIGKEKAVIKHRVGVEAELSQAAEEEASSARRKLAVRRAIEAERLRLAPELAASREKAKYARLLSPSTYSTADKLPKDVFADLNEAIFGKGVLES